MSIGNVCHTAITTNRSIYFSKNIIQSNILTDEAIQLFWNLIRETSCLHNIFRYTRTYQNIKFINVLCCYDLREQNYFLKNVIAKRIQ